MKPPPAAVDAAAKRISSILSGLDLPIRYVAECAVTAALPLLASDGEDREGGTDVDDPEMPYEELIELTLDQRKGIPAMYHQPVFDGLGKPNAWICAVCWDEGTVTRWPCEVAAEAPSAVEVAKAGGLRYAY